MAQIMGAGPPLHPGNPARFAVGIGPTGSAHRPTFFRLPRPWRGEDQTVFTRREFGQMGGEHVDNRCGSRNGSHARFGLGRSKAVADKLAVNANRAPKEVDAVHGEPETFTQSEPGCRHQVHRGAPTWWHRISQSRNLRGHLGDVHRVHGPLGLGSNLDPLGNVVRQPAIVNGFAQNRGKRERDRPRRGRSHRRLERTGKRLDLFAGNCPNVLVTERGHKVLVDVRTVRVRCGATDGLLFALQPTFRVAVERDSPGRHRPRTAVGASILRRRLGAARHQACGRMFAFGSHRRVCATVPGDAHLSELWCQRVGHARPFGLWSYCEPSRVRQ